MPGAVGPARIPLTLVLVIGMALIFQRTQLVRQFLDELGELQAGKFLRIELDRTECISSI